MAHVSYNKIEKAGEQYNGKTIRNIASEVYKNTLSDYCDVSKIEAEIARLEYLSRLIEQEKANLKLDEMSKAFSDTCLARERNPQTVKYKEVVKAQKQLNEVCALFLKYVDLAKEIDKKIKDLQAVIAFNKAGNQFSKHSTRKNNFKMVENNEFGNE